MSIELLSAYMGMKNIADLGEKLEETADMTLAEMGSTVKTDYEFDLTSREEWEKRNETGLKLAQQIKDGRTYAGESISDVKYPTIASAAISYAARAYPAIVKDQEVIKYKVIGADPDGKKAQRGARVAQYMNWELLEDIENWEEDVDKLLFLQPIVGIFYKKIYYNPVEKRTCIELVSPEDLVIYYLSSSFSKAPRKTHKLWLTYNEYVEHIRAGCYLDIDIDKPDNETEGGMILFLEQHRWFDLDGDGYEEPYIVTTHEETGQVVRIVARYEKRGISTNEKGEIVRIKEIEHFVEYPFMPSFDGGVYGMGFGILLGPINDSINTLFNQMLDAGTRANFQSGFIGRGVRMMRGGESGTLKFRRDEWKKIEVSGDDIRKAIFPLPVNPPSDILFQLLGFLTQASKELASQSELLSGQQQQHNVPATSTLALIEQGLQVFAGVYKRTYRALRKEFKRVHRLDALYLEPEKYANVIDDQTGGIEDFVTQDHDITPVSTTATVTSTQKYLKAQALMPMINQGLDDEEIRMFYLESLEIPNIERFKAKKPPEPPPQFKLAMRELDLKEREVALKERIFLMNDAEAAARIRELRERAVKIRADAILSIAKAESEEAGQQMKEYEGQMADLLGQIFAMEQADEKRRAMTQPMPAPKQVAPRGPQGPQGPPQPQGPQRPPQPQGPQGPQGGMNA